MEAWSFPHFLLGGVNGAWCNDQTEVCVCVRCFLWVLSLWLDVLATSFHLPNPEILSNTGKLATSHVQMYKVFQSDFYETHFQ